jgi:pimeloyl-ACP methyl ester carboxylesterase
MCGASLARVKPVTPPDILDDRQLEKVTMPTLLLVGENEVIYPPHKVIGRARKTIPHIKAQLVADGTHMMSWSQKETINARMIAFLLG